MEPLEFRPKHSYNFWAAVWGLCFWFFYETILANRRYLEDPSSLLHNLITLAFIFSLIPISFRSAVKRVTIEDRIIIDRYLAKPIELEPEDFIAIAGGVIHLKDCAIDTTQYRNGKKLIREFEKRIAAGMLPPGGVAPPVPLEDDDGRRRRLSRLLFWLPLLVYIVAAIALANIKGFTAPPYLDTAAYLLILAWWVGMSWFEVKRIRRL